VELKEEGVAVVSQPNTRLNIEVAKLQTFDGAANKVLVFFNSMQIIHQNEDEIWQ